MMGTGHVRHGNELYMYYWGTGRLHDSIFLRPELAETKIMEGPHGLGVVRQRLDGFMSVTVDTQGGSITTPPLVFEGSKLFVNQNCGAAGTLFVEIQDLNGNPFAGYSLADCEEITGNDVDWQVRWRGSSEINRLEGLPVRLHFRMRRSELYAFQFR